MEQNPIPLFLSQLTAHQEQKSESIWIGLLADIKGINMDKVSRVGGGSLS